MSNKSKGKRKNPRSGANSGPREYVSPVPTEMPPPVTFKLDGYVYTCRELGALELSEIARMHGMPADDPRSVAFIAELFETLLGAQMYREFRMRCGQFQTPPETFVNIIQGVFEDFTDRPTGPLSDSSNGQRSTEPKSEEDSYSQAMELLKGRPDLQQAIKMANTGKQHRGSRVITGPVVDES